LSRNCPYNHHYHHQQQQQLLQQYPDNSTLYSRAKYIWTFPEYDDWVDAIDLIFNTNETNATASL